MSSENNVSEKLIRKFLDLLEVEESKLLSWGIVDGGFTKIELVEQAMKFLGGDNDPEQIDELINSLLDSRLLFDFNTRGRRIYRTRMAEAVRLFARLRQIFPYRNWQDSPTLVGDFRFSHRSRIYPSRNLHPELVVERLREENVLNANRLKALQTLLISSDRGAIKLAEFQLQATITMLRDLHSSHKSRGMIVCAGTGTGKTLAFYLPALTHIAGLITRDTFWTKALALYPRNELLKDQFSETYKEARRLDTLLKSKGSNAGRKLIIGTYFSGTPSEATIESVKNAKWQLERNQYVCPFLRCPTCDSPVGWQQSDITEKIERLRCTTNNCQTLISEDEVILTRKRMSATPPDIVFTTTEMLNRQISDSYNGHIFGINTPHPPQLMLLDEVHTYSGVSGAQVANLLRRWQYAVGSKVQFTGLSATLRSATDFFASLTGLTPDAVQEVSALTATDTESEGTEYQLALRGDPVSGTSLLSTSIQAVMLLRRVLDPWNSNLSKGEYGKRVFVFTDDLDVTNRLYHNLLDAEGLDSWRRPLPGKTPLASLRSHFAALPAERLSAGQSWQMSEEIGHSLNNSLYVGRTSSQDIGVDQFADIVVATASLEVGFNDPHVGAVIQHKAPRNMASFLQRKGRAGRPRGMRPWTVVVLSDYGRDRIAYQGYDRLFDPLLEEQNLPVKNRYALKIQTVFAFMDWMSRELRKSNYPRGSVWANFAGPAKHEGAKIRQKRQAEIIRDLLLRPERRHTLENYLKSALVLSEEELQAMFWDPPRALMTSVLPTLLRRLESNWARVNARSGESNHDYVVKDHPLPDFVPSNLFSELNLPEVKIIAPARRPGEEPLEASMAILQAMKEFAPGRVSRRFGIHHLSISHWIAPPNSEQEEQYLPVEQHCLEYEEAGLFQYWNEGEMVDVRCVRPWSLQLRIPPKEVSVTSNAQLIWRTQIVPADEGTELDFPQHSVWSEIIKDIRFYIHNQRSYVEVRRFALGSKANITYRRPGNETIELDTTIYFTETDKSRQAAVGFVQSVDGFVIRYKVPDDFRIRQDDQNRPKIRGFRTAYFKQLVIEDSRLTEYANKFQKDWLYQVYLSTLTSTALEKKLSLKDAQDELKSKNIAEEMEQVLKVIFQTMDVDEPQSDTADGSPEHARRQSTHQRILALCQTHEVTEILHDLAKVLWEDPDDEWQGWAALRFKATLGSALLDACLQLCPQFDSGDLILDIDPGATPHLQTEAATEDLEEIWVTESTRGGGGVIEEILRRYSEDPRNFFHLVETSLEPSDFEVVDTELTQMLSLIPTDGDLISAIENVRTAYGNEQLQLANKNLRRMLGSKGILVTHSVMTAVNARILRPGSSKDTDALLLNLITRWHEQEKSLGVEIDARVFAFVAALTDDKLRTLLKQTGITGSNDLNWRFNTIYGLLWPRGNVVRSRNLSSYNPFACLPDSDRELLLDILRNVEKTIFVEASDWLTQVTQALEQNGIVSMVASPSNITKLKKAILDLSSEPINLGFLQLYPHVEGCYRDARGFKIRLRLREAVQ